MNIRTLFLWSFCRLAFVAGISAWLIVLALIDNPAALLDHDLEETTQR